MGIAADMIRQLGYTVAREGVLGTFGRAKDSAVAIPVRFLMKHPGLRDDAIVNAYGVDAQIITLPYIDEFVTEPPDKFDFVVQTPASGIELRYVFDAVVRRVVSDTTIAFTAYVKGQGAAP